MVLKKNLSDVRWLITVNVFFSRQIAAKVYYWLVVC